MSGGGDHGGAVAPSPETKAPPGGRMRRAMA
jgi:hypothetical protein